MKRSVVITMAGFGRRFLDAGFTVPKYQIVAHGQTLFWWSMIGLQHLFDSSQFVFVVRRSDEAAGFIREQCRTLGIARLDLVELDAPTDGQATSAYLALGSCDPAAPMAVFNIDTHLRPGVLGDAPAACDGWIPCFQAPGDHWSFVRLDADGRAVEVREKVRISPYATVGYYWFSTASLYRRTYDEHYGGDAPRERGEAYIAPMYNDLIAGGMRVRIADLPLDAVIALGTPSELATFTAAPRPT